MPMRSSCVFDSATLAGLLMLAATASPAWSQPSGPPDGPGPQGPAARQPIDAAHDPILTQLKQELALTDQQLASLTERFTAFRETQRRILRETMQAARPAPGEQGRPGGSPEQRAKLEATLKEKLAPIVKTFLDDTRASLAAGQQTKFDELAPKLDLSPIRGGRGQAAANTPFTLKNAVTIEEKDGVRTIRSNGIPDHQPGQFPGRGNPNAISEQRYVFTMTMSPKVGDGAPTPHRGLLAGVAINGVVFDPGTAEHWNNDPRSGWRQEAISPLTIAGGRMGLDASNAHVQPDGSYHYHASPAGIVEAVAKKRGVKDGEAMLLIGWSADGFPIYDHHGYSKADDPKSPIKQLHSSYQLKKGVRPDGSATPPGPGGAYDGTYTQDFEYVAGSGDLDECNGRFGVTPEFPSGTYYYVITDEFPFISRLFKGAPDRSFAKNDHPPPGGGRRPGRGGGPPRGDRPGPPDGPPPGAPR